MTLKVASVWRRQIKNYHKRHRRLILTARAFNGRTRLKRGRTWREIFSVFCLTCFYYYHKHYFFISNFLLINFEFFYEFLFKFTFKFDRSWLLLLS